MLNWQTKEDKVNKLAKRNSLLKRGYWPETLLWKQSSFSRLRDGSEVPELEFRRILQKPILIPNTTLAIKMAAAKFNYPDVRLFANTAFAVTSVDLAYGTLISGTGGLTSLASSSTWLAGYEWFLVDNTAAAPAGLQIDWFHSGEVTVGTTPTASTEIRLYLVGSPDGTFWPDVFDGTPSAETVTSAGVLSGFGKLASVCSVDAATSNVGYPYAFSARQWFQGTMPKKHVVFVSHNTAVNLNATAGNHQYYAQPEYITAG